MKSFTHLKKENLNKYTFFPQPIINNELIEFHSIEKVFQTHKGFFSVKVYLWS